MHLRRLANRLQRRTAFDRIIRIHRRLNQLFRRIIDYGLFPFLVDFPLLSPPVLKPYFHLQTRNKHINLGIMCCKKWPMYACMYVCMNNEPVLFITYHIILKSTQYFKHYFDDCDESNRQQKSCKTSRPNVCPTLCRSSGMPNTEIGMCHVVVLNFVPWFRTIFKRIWLGINSWPIYFTNRKKKSKWTL